MVMLIVAVTGHDGLWHTMCFLEVIVLELWKDWWLGVLYRWRGRRGKTRSHEAMMPMKFEMLPGGLFGLLTSIIVSDRNIGVFLQLYRSRVFSNDNLDCVIDILNFDYLNPAALCFLRFFFCIVLLPNVPLSGCVIGTSSTPV